MWPLRFDPPWTSWSQNSKRIGINSYSRYKYSSSSNSLYALSCYFRLHIWSYYYNVRPTWVFFFFYRQVFMKSLSKSSKEVIMLLKLLFALFQYTQNNLCLWLYFPLESSSTPHNRLQQWYAVECTVWKLLEEWNCEVQGNLWQILQRQNCPFAGLRWYFFSADGSLCCLKHISTLKYAIFGSMINILLIWHRWFSLAKVDTSSFVICG